MTIDTLAQRDLLPDLRRWTTVVAVVLFSSTLLWAQQSPPSLPDLEPVPFPDTSHLETSVAQQVDESQDLLRRSLDEDTSEARILAEAYGDLGRLYHAYDLADAASACYRNARLLSGKDFRWPYFLAVLAMQQGDLEGSIEYFRLALDRLPENLPSLVHLAEVYLTLNQPDEAELFIERALRINPGSPSALALLGQIALSRQDYATAVSALEQALALMPRADRLHYPLGQAYRGLGDLDRAREHMALRGSVGVRPPDPLIDELQELKRGEIAHVLRGRQAYRLGRLDDAVKEFEAAVEFNPKSVMAQINLGVALGQQGSTDDALMHLGIAVELAPENPTAHFDLGSLLASTGSLERGRMHLQRAVELDPEDAEAHLELASVLRRSDALAEALPHFQKAAEFAPPNEAARLGGAETLVDLERFAQAIELLEASHEMLPASGLIAHALALLLAACPDAELRDGNRALELALQVYDARKTTRHAETVALALAQLDRCEEAAQWQEGVLSAFREAGGEIDLASVEQRVESYRAGSPCRPPAASAEAP